MHLFKLAIVLLFIFGFSVTAAVDSWPRSSYTDQKQFQDIMLERHNFHRKIHSVPLVSWDDKLADFALNYSQQCDWKHSVCFATPSCNSFLLLF